MATRAYGPGSAGFVAPSHTRRPCAASLTVIAWLLAASGPALAQEGGGALAAKREFEGITPETVKQLVAQYDALRGRGRVGPMAVPDVFGHGAVLTAGKVVQKVTNFGFNGNPFLTTSSGPRLLAGTPARSSTAPTIPQPAPSSRTTRTRSSQQRHLFLVCWSRSLSWACGHRLAGCPVLSSALPQDCFFSRDPVRTCPGWVACWSR